MKVETLNNGEAFPAGHRKQGQYGLMIDFEDGRPEPQYVYAPTPQELTTKVANMYGNTNIRLAEVKNAQSAPAAPAAPAAPPATAPAAPAAAPAKMTADERMQATADLSDPAKSGAAAARLLLDETGIDLIAERQQRQRTDAAAAEKKRKEEESAKFLEQNPEWYGTRRNVTLLRDRTYARVGEKFTAADLHESYIELQQMDALELEPAGETPGATPSEEPSAPPPTRPRPSTGARPSTLGARPGAAPAGGTGITREWVLAHAGTDDYVRRLESEPGFAAKVNAVLK